MRVRQPGLMPNRGSAQVTLSLQLKFSRAVQQGGETTLFQPRFGAGVAAEMGGGGKWRLQPKSESRIPEIRNGFSAILGYFNHRWTQMSTDKNQSKTLVQQIQDRSLASVKHLTPALSPFCGMVFP